MQTKQSFLENLKQRARALQSQAYALFLAYKHPGTPWYAKLFAGLVAAYAFSPIDLVPDFIPVVGYLDDLVLIPLGVSLALKMIPEAVMDECRAEAETLLAEGKPVSRGVGVVVVLIWVGVAAAVVWWMINR